MLDRQESQTDHLKLIQNSGEQKQYSPWSQRGSSSWQRYTGDKIEGIIFTANAWGNRTGGKRVGKKARETDIGKGHQIAAKPRMISANEFIIKTAMDGNAAGPVFAM